MRIGSEGIEEVACGVQDHQLGIRCNLASLEVDLATRLSYNQEPAHRPLDVSKLQCMLPKMHRK